MHISQEEVCIYFTGEFDVVDDLLSNGEAYKSLPSLNSEKGQGT